MVAPLPTQQTSPAAPAAALEVDQAQLSPEMEAVAGTAAHTDASAPAATAVTAVDAAGASEVGPEPEAMDEDYAFGATANPKSLAVPEAPPAAAAAVAAGISPASTPVWATPAAAAAAVAGGGGCSQLLGFSSGSTPHKLATGRGAGSSRAAQRRARGRGAGHSSAAGPRWQPESLEGIGESSDPADEPQHPKQQRTAARGGVAVAEDAEEQKGEAVDEEIEASIPSPDRVITKATAAGARARQQQAAAAAAATPSHQQRQQEQHWQQQQWQPRDTGISAGSSTTCNICASDQSDSSSDDSVTGPFAGGGAGGGRAVLDDDEVESVGLHRLGVGPAAAAGPSGLNGAAGASAIAAGKH